MLILMICNTGLNICNFMWVLLFSTFYFFVEIHCLCFTVRCVYLLLYGYITYICLYCLYRYLLPVYSYTEYNTYNSTHKKKHTHITTIYFVIHKYIVYVMYGEIESENKNKTKSERTKNYIQKNTLVFMLNQCNLFE